jgi:hypothetical protein
MLTAPAPGAEYALGGDAIRIGRSEELDIWVNHRSISREHASFTREGDEVIVRDLDSANGVRVNGSDLTEAALQSGDILELGQVRFRFVAEGETYVFDAEDAHAVEAMLSDADVSRAPIMAAVVIIVVAIAAGAAIAMSGEDLPSAPPEIAHEVSPTTPAVDAEPEGPSAEARGRAAEAARSCEAAVDARRFEDALRFAAEALAADVASEPAAACKTSAEAGMREVETLARAAAALEAGDVDTAYFTVEELPIESPLRQEEAAVAARAGFIERHLGLARRALARDPTEAARQANIVLTVEGVGERETRDAEAIIARAARRGVAVATPSTEPTEPAPSRSTTMRRARHAPSPRTPPRETTAATQLTAPVATEPAASPVEEARLCLEGGDHRCAVRALEGHSGSPGALAMLIDSYLALGDHASAIRHMRSFVTRFPDDRRTERYRRFLETLQ